MSRHENLGLTKDEIRRSLADSKWANKPVLTLEEASELSTIPIGTLYDYSSRGLLKRCASKVGRHILVNRDRLISMIFNEGFTNDEQTA